MTSVSEIDLQTLLERSVIPVGLPVAEGSKYRISKVVTVLYL